MKTAITTATAAEGSGLICKWATIVDRDGVVCAVASRLDRERRPGSRDDLSAEGEYRECIQPRQTLLSPRICFPPSNRAVAFRLAGEQPRRDGRCLRGSFSNYGKSNDPMVGRKIGGVNVFGGGLALYNSGRKVVGGVGVGGDTSCADHFIAWRVRKLLNLDNVLTVGGVSGDGNRPDNIVFDITANPAGSTGNSAEWLRSSDLHLDWESGDSARGSVVTLFARRGRMDWPFPDRHRNVQENPSAIGIAFSCSSM